MKGIKKYHKLVLTKGDTLIDTKQEYKSSFGDRGLVLYIPSEKYFTSKVRREIGIF